MPYAALGEFLAELQDHGELLRIAATVDSALELAAITDHITKSAPDGGPVLLFESVKNCSIPVVTNLLGSRCRVCRSLNVEDLDQIPTLLDQRLQFEQPGGWLESLKLVPGLPNLGRWTPKAVKTAACQQVVRLGRDVNLWDLPVPRSWPGESHPVITSGQLLLRHPETGNPFVCQSPLAVTGPQELAWYDANIDQTAIANHVRTTKQNLAVAISLGGDPLLALLAALPMIDDFRLFAGLLRGVALETVRCRTNELEVPAGSEIVIEGYLDAEHSTSAAPISVARSNGRYVERTMPLIQVTAVTHRANPIFPALVAAPPPSEESWILRAGERIILPVLKRMLPEIVDIHQPFSAAGRNLIFVSIRKTSDHQARRVLHALWGTPMLGQTKIIVLVDADQDLQREDQVWFTVGTHANPASDFVFSDGLARDDDYTPVSASLASRVGIDATRKRVGELLKDWPQTMAVAEETASRLRERWVEYGLDACRK